MQISRTVAEAWVGDGHGKLSSFVNQIWLLLSARLSKNLTNFTGEQYLNRGRSNSEPISLGNIGKRVREDVSFEESESTPPAKVERKKSPDKKEFGQAAPDWAQLIYNEIFEIKLQVRNVLDMKEEIKGEIRNEITDFKQIMESEQQELKSSIQFISDQYDSLRTSQQTNEEKCVTLKNENICMKGTISSLLNKIDELEQYSLSARKWN